MSHGNGNGSERPVVITGGAGFVGTNLADYLLRRGEAVVVLDDLSRPGVDRNLAWLEATHGDRLRAEIADVRSPEAVARAVASASAVYHFAAQVAVTTSLENPVHDFEVNARGTLNVLEALWALEAPPPLVFTSTNKVYGDLGDVELAERGARWEPADTAVRERGISEARPLEFHSPYGCSKGAADQYVLDYARTFGLPATVLRMSCIYGPHQCGNEDQGWVAHFLISALDGRPITLYGDGKQVRDVLYVGDLVAAMVVARERIDELAGRAFNIGGGPESSTSLLELIDRIAEVTGRRPEVAFDDWRPGDQRYYVSDTSAFEAATGWRPTTGVGEGVEALHSWLVARRESSVETPPARLVAVPATERRAS